MVGALKRGDKVITSGGIVGTIDKVLEGDKIDLSIADNVIVQVVKSTIQTQLNNSEVKK